VDEEGNIDEALKGNIPSAISFSIINPLILRRGARKTPYLLREKTLMTASISRTLGGD